MWSKSINENKVEYLSYHIVDVRFLIIPKGLEVGTNANWTINEAGGFT